MRVAYLHRRVGKGVYSLEGYFRVVREHLPPDIEANVAVAPRVSRGLLPRLANILWARRHQADVTHVTGDIHYVSFLLDRRRTVLTVLDCIFVQNPSRVRRAALRYLWLSIPEKRVSVITTISEFTRRQVLDATGCDPAKVKVVYACISPTFRPVPVSVRESRPTVLHVGTTANKNLERLCAAIRGLDCRLHVVGPLTASQRSALSGLDWVNSVHLDEAAMLRAYAECDLLAFVSTYEGFGLPIVEANAVGRPVVTGNVASMPEIAGDAACLVDPFDVNSIRAGIRSVLESPSYRDSLIAKGLSNARRFEPRAIAMEYASIYRSLYA